MATWPPRTLAHAGKELKRLKVGTWVMNAAIVGAIVAAYGGRMAMETPDTVRQIVELVRSFNSQ
jgi:hypothetical protein